VLHDCLVIGYHDVGFARIAAEAQAAERYSGHARALRAESLFLDGARLPYMDVLNRALTEVWGHDPRLHVTEVPSLAGIYLKSYLLRRGFRVEVVDSFTHEQARLARLLAAGARSVAITTTFYVEPTPIREIVAWVRKVAPDTRIIVGGPHVLNLVTGHDPGTAAYMLEGIGADLYVVDSQGEAALASVLAALRDDPDELTRIPNVAWRGPNGRITFNKRAPERNNLDAEAVDWALLGTGGMFPTMQMRTARSCAFRCAFCSYPAMAGPLDLASMATVDRELRALHEAGVRDVVFIDDTFNVPLPRFKDVCRLLARYDMRWFSYFRCSNADDEAFDLMAASGCAGVFLGIESGDQTVLNAMNKSAKVERYVHGIRALRARGITTFASLIVGFPGETEATLANTRTFLEEAMPTYYRAELYYHETLADVPIRKREAEVGLKGGGYGWSHATMNWQRAADGVEWLYRSVHGPSVLPSYMFNFWALPYLCGRGLDLPTIERFAAAAHPMLVADLDRVEPPPAAEAQERLRALARALGDVRPAQPLIPRAPAPAPLTSAPAG
jgi:radical SAM PhpK family P-methyltransferase